ncbi:Uncharacterised protein [Vibrio cholerae]|nr:Uncharacterised protein [Vibrio cholerae]
MEVAVLDGSIANLTEPPLSTSRDIRYLESNSSSREKS